MKLTTFQHPELRDANDNIIQEGTYGKASPLVNGDNTGVLDYINNNLEALHDNINGARIYVANKAALPTTGDLSAMYIAEDTGKWYLWDGTKYIETDNARKIADEAIAARDAAKASQSAASTSANNAKASETNAASSASAAAGSATNAANSATAAGTQAATAKNWAEATTSPDNAADTASTTGKTQSAKSWALYSKDRATASASSATAAAGSASAAKTSETNAASSKSAAATSATNAANSAKAAANSATAAANSAREQQADWNVMDSTSKAFIKNKPTKWDVLDLTKPLYKNGALDYTTRPLVDVVRANKLAFLPAEQIIIEQTVDGGQTWTDAGFQDVKKENLFNELKTFALSIPQINGKENAQCGLRVTITAMKYNVPDGTAETDKYKYWGKDYVKSTERYCTLEELYIWCSAASNKIKVKVESATGDNPDNWYTQFSSDSFGLAGEAGGNYIRLKSDFELFGGQISQVSNFWNYRFTFMTTSKNLTDEITDRPEVAQSIININGYGTNMWKAPNQLALYDHLYYWDDKQNATFPANINAKGKLLENGQSITDGIAQRLTTNTLTATDATFTGETSVPTANAGNSSKAIANTEFVAKSISALVNGAPDQLNTLNELAKALGNDSNFATTVINELGKKMDSAEAESTYAKKEEAGVLSGTVMAFSGTFNNGYPIDKNSGLADKKWHLCDGTNGTPDLRQRFILGGNGTNNGATGGEASVTLTQQTIPAHNHTAICSTNGDHSHGLACSAGWDGTVTAGYSGDSRQFTRQTDSAGSHSHTITIDNTGGGQPHNNMPPYYTLAFIMKL